MKKLLIVLIIICFCLGGCSRKQQDMTDDNYRVFYEIFVGSFSDSNGDGTGDIRGIINRMDYLNDGNVNSKTSLGVQGIWLTPVFKSPSYHKYDVQDYYSIDEKFGTMEDLEELIKICHERNVKIILDLPINHTSSENKWFKQFCNARINENIDDNYYDFYCYATRTTCPPGRSFRIMSGSFDGMYEANFSYDMPELNYDNPQVRQQVLDIARFYLDKGIDGFRFDAVKYIYYGDTTASVDFWKWYMSELRKINPDIYCVGECWSGDGEVLQYTEALNCFCFTVSQADGYIASAVQTGNVNSFTSYVDSYTKKLKQMNENAMFMPFIANHDMDRAAGFVNVSSQQAFMAANLYILCSGSPFIYYGEEIGLKGSRGSSQTDANRRLAMLWGDDDKVSDPIGATYGRNKQVNGTVAEQNKKDDSILNYYRRLIHLRNKYPAIARGEYTKISGIGKFGGFKISYNDEMLIIIHNVTSEDIEIPLESIGASKLLDYIGMGKASVSANILKVGKLTSVILK